MEVCFFGVGAWIFRLIVLLCVSEVLKDLVVMGFVGTPMGVGGLEERSGLQKDALCHNGQGRGMKRLGRVRMSTYGEDLKEFEPSGT